MAKIRLGSHYLRTFGDTWRKASESHLKDLYAALIAPIRKHLQAAHLVIAPHGYLHQLPFHALLGDRGYLTDEFSISYAPSGSVYALCASRPRSPYKDSLIMGIPDAYTPDVEDEVRSIASLVANPRLFVGTAATGDVIRQYAPVSRIVHIATHGTFRSDNPTFSSIQLSDGPFNLTDLYRFPMNADIVTLSGCSTGLNAVVGGDELIGLMRGFLSGGARSLLVSLWEVNDRCTAEFMTSFYRNLVDTNNNALAFRRAMRETRERYPHPYYWSPFILVGTHSN
jgi:CHAT domain-containing protein